MLRSSLLTAALLVSAGAIPGAAEPGAPEFRVAPGTDFSAYSSYAWLPFPPGSGRSVEVRNPTAHRLIQAAVEKDLDSKNLSSTRATPDLHITYEVHREGGGRNLAPSGYSASASFEDRADAGATLAGTLVVNIYDARTRALIWRGWASEVFSREELLDFSTAEEKISGVVSRVMSRFPPPTNPE
jgi:hypothetical protein